VATINTGMAASMGAVLLCAGTAGKRVVFLTQELMIHQPMGERKDKQMILKSQRIKSYC